MAVRIPKSRISIGVQNLHIRKRFPSFRLIRVGTPHWKGKLDAEFDSYDVRIIPREQRSPKVFVMNPKPVEKAKHVYADGSLCLFYPPDRSWTDRSLIAETTIPWTAEWLFFYEVWLKTGKWLGGGVHGASKEE